jgi:hypothetical protein
MYELFFLPSYYPIHSQDPVKGGEFRLVHSSQATGPRLEGLSGMAAELMQRLDPRLKYLVTQEALTTLEDDISEGGGDDCPATENEDDGEEEEGMFTTLSGVKLQVSSLLISHIKQANGNAGWQSCETSNLQQNDASPVYSERPVLKGMRWCGNIVLAIARAHKRHGFTDPEFSLIFVGSLIGSWCDGRGP